MLFAQIVVPVDLSDRHQPPLDPAAWLIERDRGGVTLLHVMEGVCRQFCEEMQR